MSGFVNEFQKLNWNNVSTHRTIKNHAIIKYSIKFNKALRQLPENRLEFYVHITPSFTNQDYVAILTAL